MHRARTAAAVAVLALFAAGCNGDPVEDPTLQGSEFFSPIDDPSPTEPSSSPTPTASSTPVPSPSPTPTVAAEWAVPDPITEDYVTRVLNELHRLEVPIVQEELDRIAAGEPRLAFEELQRRYRATRTEGAAGAAANEISGAQADLMTETLDNPLGAPSVSAIQLREESEDCAIALAEVDMTSWGGPLDSRSELVTIRTELGNTTGWKIDDVATADSNVPSC